MIGDNPEVSVGADPDLTEIREADCSGLGSDPKCKKRIFSVIASSRGVSQMMLLQNITFTQLKQIVQKNPPIKSIKQDIQLLGLVFFFLFGLPKLNSCLQLQQLSASK